MKRISSLIITIIIIISGIVQVQSNPIKSNTALSKLYTSKTIVPGLKIIQENKVYNFTNVQNAITLDKSSFTIRLKMKQYDEKNNSFNEVMLNSTANPKVYNSIKIGMPTANTCFGDGTGMATGGVYDEMFLSDDGNHCLMYDPLDKMSQRVLLSKKYADGYIDGDWKIDKMIYNSKTYAVNEIPLNTVYISVFTDNNLNKVIDPGELVKVQINFNSGYQKPTNANKSKDIEGNTNGNLQNGGYAAKQGDFIYYANPSDKYKLYKIKNNNTMKTKLSNDTVADINVVSNWIYYKNTKDNKLYKVKVDGKNRTTLTNTPVESVHILNGYIYFMSPDKDLSDCIYKMSIDGSKKKLLINTRENAYNLAITSNYLYYRISGYNASARENIVRLYRAKLDGTDIKEIMQQVTYMDASGDWLYTIALGDQIYRERANAIRADALDTGRAEHINVSGSWIYYINDSDNKALYKIKTDGTQKTKIYDFKGKAPRYLCVVGNWIYTDIAVIKNK